MSRPDAAGQRSQRQRSRGLEQRIAAMLQSHAAARPRGRRFRRHAGRHQRGQRPAEAARDARCSNARRCRPRPSMVRTVRYRRRSSPRPTTYAPRRRCGRAIRCRAALLRTRRSMRPPFPRPGADRREPAVGAQASSGSRRRRAARRAARRARLPAPTPSAGVRAATRPDAEPGVLRAGVPRQCERDVPEPVAAPPANRDSPASTQHLHRGGAPRSAAPADGTAGAAAPHQRVSNRTR